MERTLRVGVDENGLGPRLGPLVVTGVLIALDAPERHSAAEDARSYYRDSKELCAHGDMAEVEAMVLSTLDVHLDARPLSYAALQALLGMQTNDALRALCPEGESPRMCFGHDLALPCFGGAVTEASLSRARRAKDGGLTLLAATQAYACARSLNAERAAARSRFDVDLAWMIAVVDALRSRAPEDVTAVCGKVGGRKSYGAAMSARWPLVAVIEEGAARSSYAVPRVGRVEFTRDADATDVAVSLASLIGKYARELAMARIHAYLRTHLPALRPASGYHDPVTARYVDATRLLRRERGIEDRCFER